MFSPFRVSWTLRAAIRRPDDPIHLDALLAWAVVDEAREAGHPDPISEQESLPLARHDSPEGWCWQASQLDFTLTAPAYSMFLTRPTRVHEYAAGRLSGAYVSGMDKITLGTGRHKAFLFNHRMQQASTAVAYGVGDVERVRELLVRVTSIGKLQRFNAGAITQVSVVEDPTAHQRWQRRIMPSMTAGYAQVVACVRPPYWKRGQRQVAYAPMDIPKRILEHSDDL